MIPINHPVIIGTRVQLLLSVHPETEHKVYYERQNLKVHGSRQTLLTDKNYGSHCVSSVFT